MKIDFGLEMGVRLVIVDRPGSGETSDCRNGSGLPNGINFLEFKERLKI